MLLLRILAPADLAPTALAYLETIEGVQDLVYFAGASRRPAGDLIHCVVAPELGSVLVSGLTALGIAERGSISFDRLEATLSKAASATRHNAGAVVWEEVDAKTAPLAGVTPSFLAYLMSATVLVSIAIITDSVVLLIGAMVVGPEFGPMAALCVAVIQRRFGIVRQALVTLAVGFPLAMLAAFVATWAFRVTGIAPEVLISTSRASTMFISEPDAFSVMVAAICGVVGMLSLTTQNAGTLIGVLISVTTIPAAGNVGVAAAYGNFGEMSGALIQLGVNLVVFLIAALLTLRVQRASFAARVVGFVERVRELRPTRSDRASRG